MLTRVLLALWSAIRPAIEREPLRQRLGYEAPPVPVSWALAEPADERGGSLGLNQTVDSLRAARPESPRRCLGRSFVLATPSPSQSTWPWASSDPPSRGSH